jgi:hypothetical protein
MVASEIVFKYEDSHAAIRRAWVVVRSGDTTTVLHTDDDGVAHALAAGKDEKRPWSFTERFTLDVKTPSFFGTGSKSKIIAYYSRGARPIPAETLSKHADCFFEREIAWPDKSARPALVAPNNRNQLVAVPIAEVLLPRVALAITVPAELSLWALLFQPHPPAYYTREIPQGRAFWAQRPALELEPAPAPEHPHAERGLLLHGIAEPGAETARVRVYHETRKAWVKLREGPTDMDPAGKDEVTAVLASQGDTRTFEKIVYFRKPSDAFGPVSIVIVCEKKGAKPVVGAFSAQLTGVQGALVNDHPDNDGNHQLDDGAAARDTDGSVRGPVRGEADERIVVDFTASPTDGAAHGNTQTPTNLAQRDNGRARAMAVYYIRANRQRPLARTAVSVAQNEMPLWMAELHLVGTKKADLEDLLLRRKHRRPREPATLTLGYRWKVEISWKGPDHGLEATRYFGNLDASTQRERRPHIIRPYTDTFNGIWTAGGLRQEAQTVTFRLDKSGNALDPKAVLEVDAADAHKAKAPFSVVPVALPFPTANRRVPAVWVDGQRRAWGRTRGAETQDTVVIEWQVAVVDGVKWFRGHKDDGSVFEESVPDVGVPDSRVLGKNATNVRPTIDAVTDRYHADHPELTQMRALSAAAWRQAIRYICTHESAGGHQFWHKSTDANWLNDSHCSYGHERGTPYFGGPQGYGIGQKDPAPRRDALFDYVEAIEVACDELMRDKVRATMNSLALDLTLESHRAALLRSAVRAYNGGSELAFRNGVLVIQPRRCAGHQEYPNSVLGTAVPYGDLSAPGVDSLEWRRQYFWPNGGNEP